MSGVRTRQWSTHVVSRVVHKHLGGNALMCRPRGVKSEILPADDEPVDCQMCLRSEVTAGAPQPPPPPAQPRPTPPAEPRAEQPPKVWPRKVWPRKPPPPPVPGSMDVTALMEMLRENRDILDVRRPIRCVGRFDSSSPIVFMVSEDGSLCVMGND